jgi:hypothetical protein
LPSPSSVQQNQGWNELSAVHYPVDSVALGRFMPTTQSHPSLGGKKNLTTGSWWRARLYINSHIE